MPLKITITSDVLLNETRRNWVMGKIGWDSASMDAVRTALDAYHLDKSEVNRQAVQYAVYNWKQNKWPEFKKRDEISGGLATKLAVQCGLDSCRPPPTPAVRFRGEVRNAPTKRKAPHVTLLHDSVVNVLRENAADSAVVVIDLYDDDFADQGLDLRYGTNSTVAENIIQLLRGTRFKGPRGTVNIPVYVCCKTTTKSGEEIVSTFKNAIANKNFQLIVSGTSSVLKNTGLKASLDTNNINTVFVAGFDANLCVATSIFGNGAVGTDYDKGFLDYGFDVVTSRFIVASGDRPLQGSGGWPYMGNCNK